MNVNTFRILEFDLVRRLLAEHAGSSTARRRLLALEPLRDRGDVQEALSRTSEGVRLLAALGRQPYHDLPDIAGLLPKILVEGAHLEPEALLDVASFVEGALEIAGEVRGFIEAPSLARLASEVPDLTEIASMIRRSILPSRELADDASPRLLEIRRSLARLKAHLQSVMESFLHGKDAERILQDRLVTSRNDRYVLILKAEHRGQLPGIVHGASGSGASLFVEPLGAVELNNDIVSLADEERAEVSRILAFLTARVRDRVFELTRSNDLLGELDRIQAMALLAGDMGASEPKLSETGELDIVEARHPFLMAELAERLGLPKRTSKEPVAVNLRVGGRSKVLVISGPNTGGKTVALKTVGLLALMAQCGLHVPASPESQLPVFKRIYADIGDDQSIAQSLSTFSAHLASIVEMTKDLEAPCLVLLDEVGAGTDPTEGGGLGVAIVDHFRREGALVVATTHHGLMKAYAQSTEGVSCASFGYDPRTYAPTFRLALGVPGRSLALEMAERLGLPKRVVEDARSRISEKDAQAEALLRRLEDERLELDRARDQIGRERLQNEAERQALAVERKGIVRERDSELEALRKEVGRRAEELSRSAAEAIREAVKRVEASQRTAASVGEKARSAALRTIRAAQVEALLESSPAVAEAPKADLHIGSRTRVASLGLVGEILSFPGGDLAELAVSGKRMRVPVQELTAVAAAPPSTQYTNHLASRAVQKEGAAEINVVGLTVDEALPRVDKFLDDAAIAERREVRVIHGFGQGKLRRAVAGLLDGHPHVATFRLGGSREGGGGATIVELKD